MFTVSFYSYKGGVGRTMALANTAVRLSAKGKRVFILDFDLEAPGVSSFFPDTSRHPGVLEYIHAYLQNDVVPPLNEFVSNVPSTGSRSGPIFCMGAGICDETYQELLAPLNWKEFYTHRNGFLLIENLKGAIEATYSPDYLLVDSRTGFTDVSGVCTLQLPNLVVFLFALNEQNLEGTARIYKSVAQNKLNRPIQTLLVASPVPDLADYAGVKQQRLTKAKELLGSEIKLSIPFAPIAAFEETILAPRSSDYLGRAYDELTEAIVHSNTSDVLTLLAEAKDLRREGDPERTEAKFRQILEGFPNSPEVWTSYGLFLRSFSRLEEATKAFSRAIELHGPKLNFAELAVTLLAMGQKRAATENFYAYLEQASHPRQILRYTEVFERRGELEPTIVGYTRMLDLWGDDVRAVSPLNSLGNVFLRQRDPARAIRFYRKAVELLPNNLPCTYNLGYALELLGNEDEAKRQFERAVALYEHAPVPPIPAGRANWLQAIGHAYAVLGYVQQAAERLSEAREISGRISSPIFSAIQYRDVSPQEFRHEVSEMIARLEALEQRR